MSFVSKEYNFISGIGEVNQAGVDYYNALIDELLDNGIEPAVTLYHWDLPQDLEDLDGWRSDLSPSWFEEYARACYENFGDRVSVFMQVIEYIHIQSNFSCLCTGENVDHVE